MQGSWGELRAGLGGSWGIGKIRGGEGEKKKNGMIQSSPLGNTNPSHVTLVIVTLVLCWPYSLTLVLCWPYFTNPYSPNPSPVLAPTSLTLVLCWPYFPNPSPVLALTSLTLVLCWPLLTNPSPVMILPH
jgi:hypothetical protein